MIKIGELAKICRVSVQTLRYYDKIGLLCSPEISGLFAAGDKGISGCTFAAAAQTL